MSKNSCRKYSARDRRDWHRIGTQILVAVCVLSGFGPARGRAAPNDKPGPWMISGKIASGLASSQLPSDTSKTAQRWKAGVRESDWQYIIIHHSGTRSGSVEAIHQEHSRRKDSDGNPWLGIGYHFVIGNGDGMPDGAIQSTFRWEKQLHGAHSGNALFNARGIGICLIGNFDQTMPTDGQLKSVRSLVQALASQHEVTRDRILGHASVKPTACPGKHFPLSTVRQVVPE